MRKNIITFRYYFDKYTFSEIIITKKLRKEEINEFIQ